MSPPWEAGGGREEMEGLWTRPGFLRARKNPSVTALKKRRATSPSVRDG